MEKLIVSSSPHIRAKMSTRRIMLEVMIALAPALLAGIVFFGLYALLIVLVTVGSAVLGEFLFNVITKKKQTIGDLSAIVTGLILGLNLPPAVPVYVPIIGGIFATMVVKMLFGGLGKNFANPAATARIFLLLTWAAQMTTYVAPLTYAGGGIFHELTKYFGGIVGTGGLDGMTTSTPLSQKGDMNILHLFLGNVGGCIGETSALAIMIGGGYLIARRLIDYKIPAIYIGTFAFFTLVFTGSYTAILPELLSGGLMLGAFFMATDYATSPNTKCGTVIYAMGLGLVTVVLRQLTAMPEGTSYAIVLMNLIVPLLDKAIVPHSFGSKKKPVLLLSLTSVLAAMFIATLSWSLALYGSDMRAVNAFGEEKYTAQNVIVKRPQAKMNVYYTASNSTVYRVTGLGGYRGEDEKGKGYVDLLIKMVDGKITAIEVTASDQPKNAAALGAQFMEENFIGKSLALFQVGENVAAPEGDRGTAEAVCNGVSIVYDFAGGVI